MWRVRSLHFLVCSEERLKMDTELAAKKESLLCNMVTIWRQPVGRRTARGTVYQCRHVATRLTYISTSDSTGKKSTTNARRQKRRLAHKTKQPVSQTKLNTITDACGGVTPYDKSALFPLIFFPLDGIYSTIYYVGPIDWAPIAISLLIHLVVCKRAANSFQAKSFSRATRLLRTEFTDLILSC